MVMCIFTLYFVLFQVLLWRQEAAELPYTEEAAVEHGNVNRSQGCFFPSVLEFKLFMFIMWG